MAKGKKPLVVVTRKLPDTVETRMRELFDAQLNLDDKPMSQAQLIEAVKVADVLVPTVTDRIDAAVLGQSGDKLRLIANFGNGVDNIDVASALQRGITVTNTPGVLTDSVADYSMGLIIATCRRMTEGEAYLRKGKWKGTFLKQMLGQDVHGATLGVFGFGRIGQAIARRARGFDMKILYHSRNRAAVDAENESGAAYAGKEELLRRADVVLLILPFTPETQHFIGAKELALMKPTAVLINMARGGIVDDAALIEALKKHRIWAAGLDVYENEPKLNPRFLEIANVVLSPHIASASGPTRQAMAMTAAKNLAASLSGQTPTNLLNPDYVKYRKT